MNEEKVRQLVEELVATVDDCCSCQYVLYDFNCPHLSDTFACTEEECEKQIMEWLKEIY